MTVNANQSSGFYKNRTASSPLTNEMRREIAGAVAEIDLAQVAIARKLTPAERVQQAVSMIEAAEQVSVYRLRQREPHLSEEEAYRIVRQGLTRYWAREKRRKHADAK